MMRDLQKLGPPSYAFINPRALSAGAMIAVATDAIYIAPAGSARKVCTRTPPRSVTKTLALKSAGASPYGELDTF